jgi:hypothetical protein
MGLPCICLSYVEILLLIMRLTSSVLIGYPLRVYSLLSAADMAMTASPVCSKRAWYNSKKSTEIARRGWFGVVGKNPWSIRMVASDRHWQLLMSIAS